MQDTSFERLLGVLISPGKTFQAIARRPTWGVALLVLALTSTLATAVVFQRVDIGEFMAEAAARQGQGAATEMPEGLAAVMAGVIVISAGAAVVAAAMAMALVFWALFKALGSTLDFPGSLAATVHGLMPQVVASLLMIPVAYGRQSISYDDAQSGILASNLGFLGGEEASPGLLALLTSADLFSLWSMVLLSIGFAAVARTSIGKAAAVVVTLWLLYVLGKVGLAVAFA